jgi:hypothetical protein
MLGADLVWLIKLGHLFTYRKNSGVYCRYKYLVYWICIRQGWNGDKNMMKRGDLKRGEKCKIKTKWVKI